MTRIEARIEARKELIAALVRVQNDERNWNRDIMTITGFMADAEVARHLKCEQARLTPINVALATLAAA